MRKLTVGSCFSGIGGLELGLEWTGGFETKWQIEIDPYARRVLEKHWPRVERYTDITTVERPPRVDVICGGFPCQDVSLAGARAGLGGKRSTLWSELFRLVCEVKPRWLVAENVPGLLSSDGGRFMGNILRDLASIGLDAEWGVLSAAGVGAPHLRRRVFILAHSYGDRRNDEGDGEAGTEGTPCGPVVAPGEQRTDSPQRLASVADASINARRVGDRDGKDDDLAYAASRRLSRTQQKSRESRKLKGAPTIGTQSPNDDWWHSEPSVGRVAHGIPSRVDRLRCLGNAVVPQVAEKVGRMILEYERNRSI